MHTKHEMKEESEKGVITMVVSQGLFIIGKLIGGNKLVEPRVFSIIPNLDENGMQGRDENGRPKELIQMAPLPGTPPMITLGNDKMGYPIPETKENNNILELYDKVTRPKPEAPFLVKPTSVNPDITGSLN